MGIRCNMIFVDPNYVVQIYRHWDGYPSEVLPDLDRARKLAWEFPRFEADEFSAAVVATMKTGDGNIRIQYPPPRDNLLANVQSDCEWVYVIEATREFYGFEEGSANYEPTLTIYDWDYWFDKPKDNIVPAMTPRPFSEGVKWDQAAYDCQKYPEDCENAQTTP